MTKLYKNLDDPRTSVKRKYWIYKCDCGNEVSLRSDSKAKHCSGPECTFSTYNRHGESETRLYAIWSGMRDRCFNSHHSSDTYKDRGISISPDWDLFVHFKAWAIASGYTDALTIDRIDIDGNYSPENCEWVTREENTKRQVRDNHSNQRAIKVSGVDFEYTATFQSIAEAARVVKKLFITKPVTHKTVCAYIGHVLNGTKSEVYGLSFNYIVEKTKEVL